MVGEELPMRPLTARRRQVARRAALPAPELRASGAGAPKPKASAEDYRSEKLSRGRLPDAQ